MKLMLTLGATVLLVLACTAPTMSTGADSRRVTCQDMPDDPRCQEPPPPAKPDLVITAEARLDNGVTYTYHVRNIGNATADLTNVAVQVRYSSDAVYDGGDYAVNGWGLEFITPTLAPGATIDSREIHIAPIAINPRYVVLKVDENNALSESSENNNTVAAGPLF